MPLAIRLSTLACLLLAGLGLPAHATPCGDLDELAGQYHCAGECLSGSAPRTLQNVTDESDWVQPVAGSQHGLYQVLIHGAQQFRELEIGARHGNTLQAATAEVSDGHYPVLETYTFYGDTQCRARGYVKTVLNPNPDTFKSCRIECRKP